MRVRMAVRGLVLAVSSRWRQREEVLFAQDPLAFSLAG